MHIYTTRINISSGYLPDLTDEIDIAAEIAGDEAHRRYAETAVAFMVDRYQEVLYNCVFVGNYSKLTAFYSFLTPKQFQLGQV